MRHPTDVAPDLHAHPSGAGEAPRRVKAYSSGFIIDPTGLIVTNKHVIDGAFDIRVIFNDHDREPARLVAAAEMVDLAVLQVEAGQSLPYLKWSDSDRLQIGDPVLTIGNPMGIGMSASAGIISAIGGSDHLNSRSIRPRQQGIPASR